MLTIIGEDFSLQEPPWRHAFQEPALPTPASLPRHNSTRHPQTDPPPKHAPHLPLGQGPFLTTYPRKTLPSQPRLWREAFHRTRLFSTFRLGHSCRRPSRTLVAARAITWPRAPAPTLTSQDRLLSGPRQRYERTISLNYGPASRRPAIGPCRLASHAEAAWRTWGKEVWGPLKGCHNFRPWPGVSSAKTNYKSQHHPRLWKAFLRN